MILDDINSIVILEGKSDLHEEDSDFVDDVFVIFGPSLASSIGKLMEYKFEACGFDPRPCQMICVAICQEFLFTNISLNLLFKEEQLSVTGISAFT